MPAHFTCPHCGVTNDVADQHAGQTSLCTHCGKTVAVPLPGCVAPFGNCRHRFPTEVKALLASFVVLPCIGILIALLLPAVQAVREAARRETCANNLKAIGMAMQNYAATYGCFPPAFVADKHGKPMHSWRVLILPYIEQADLYNQYRLDEPWNGPHNRALASRMPRVYCCPTEHGPDFSETSYAMLVGPHAFSDGPSPRHIGNIKDGLSNTIMVAECAGAGINWLDPRDLKTDEMTFHVKALGGDARPGKSDISSDHSGMAFAVFCDGSVRPLSSSLNPKVLEALTTIDGGESINMDDLR